MQDRSEPARGRRDDIRYFLKKIHRRELPEHQVALAGVRRSQHESGLPVGLTGPRKIGYIAGVIGEDTEIVGL